MFLSGGRSGLGFPGLLGLLGLLGVVASLACSTPTLQGERTLVDVDPRQEARFSEGPPERVFLITVAGLRAADYLDPFGHAAAEGALVHMPTLARMAREGATGLAAIPPAPSAARATHATLVTGRTPPRHGIVADATLDGEGTRSLPFHDSRLLQGTTLWDAAVARGVVSLGWPTTTGARIELLLPEPTGEGLAFARPGTSPALTREIATIAAETREARDGELERAVPWPSAREEDGVLVEVACRLIASERDAGLWLLRLDQTLGPLAAFGPGSVEADDAFDRVDAEIERLVDCLSTNGQIEDTAIFVTGDAAHHPVHTRVAPNTALARKGLVGRDPRTSTGVRSWLALARSHGRSAYVYARDAANALDARDVLREEADRTGAFELVSAKELAILGGDPQAWFALVSPPGIVISDDLSGPLLAPARVRGAPGVLGEGTEQTSVGFVAWGRGVRNHVRLPSVDLLDVAPTISALLGLRLGKDVDGEPILGILRAAVEPPPAGPRRLGQDRDADSRLRELRRGREESP
ncbi:MAG: alkaline phosphatase family protein [bacterium]|nr:alkaline phosphatase family protein [bacterium]